MSVLSSYRKNLLLLLKEGFNPFVDNTELYQQLKSSVLPKGDDTNHFKNIQNSLQYII